MKRTLIAGSALVLAALALPVPAAQAAGCSGTSGVTVVVQFPDGHVETGCAPGDPDSGLKALESAGFPYTFVPNQAGAVCTIKGAPASNCWGNSYWAYFHGSGSTGWTYSTAGAGSYDPKPGSREGWRFGADECGPQQDCSAPAPTPTPTRKPTRNPTPATTPQPSVPKPGTTTATGATVAAPGATAGSTPTGTATVAPTTSGAATATADPTATATTTAVAAGPAGAESVDGTDPASSGASWVWGVGLLAALAAVGGVVAIRRRG